MAVLWTGASHPRCARPFSTARYALRSVEPLGFSSPGTFPRLVCDHLAPHSLVSFDLENGGEGGIRTPDRFNPIPAFQASAFDHSATSPGALHVRQTKVRNEKNGQIRGIPRHRSNGKSSDLIRKPSSRAIHSLVSLLLMLLGREPVGPDTPSPERTSSHLNLPP